MLKHPKDYYREKGKSFNMAWGGFDEGVHFFQEGDYRTGFKVMYCTEECLENGNAYYMATHGWTLSDEKVKELQKKYRKAELKKLNGESK